MRRDDGAKNDFEEVEGSVDLGVDEEYGELICSELSLQFIRYCALVVTIW